MFKPVIFLLWSTLCFSQDFKGQLIDSVSVGGTADETFQLYLPSEYTPNSLSAIVFIFDPTGSGKNGIDPFLQAAEKYNYILVCSNNAKNGPLQLNFDIANRLFNEVFLRFNIDPKQIYLAGFSGGSRFSTAVAVLTNQIQGVIACGSGFPDNISYAPISPDFTYAAVIGDRDMNFSEMSNNFQYLKKLNFTTDLFVFDGPHVWPPREKIMEVFDWFEILAYKKGLRVQNDQIITENYSETYNNYLQSAQLLRKEALLNRMMSTYGIYFKTDSLRSKLLKLRNSEAFQRERSNQDDIFELEESLIKTLTGRFHSDYKNPEKANLKWWSQEMARLEKIGSKGLARQKMVERLKYKLFELAYTRSRPEYFDVNPEQQNFCYSLIQNLNIEFN